jgi:hypothetical protein
MEARVTGPDGREWVVRSFRYRRPPWRQAGVGVVTQLLVPLVVFAGEAAGRGVWSLVASRRWVEAVHEGPPFSRMSWETKSDDASAVVDQVARQLELGYDRIQPHRARFLGFR